MLGSTKNGSRCSAQDRFFGSLVAHFNGLPTCRQSGLIFLYVVSAGYSLGTFLAERDILLFNTRLHLASPQIENDWFSLGRLHR